jgi:hypothetical protein
VGETKEEEREFGSRAAYSTENVDGGEKRGWAYASMHRSDLDRVRNNVGSHPLLDRADFRERDGELFERITSARLRAVVVGMTNRCDPSEDVGIEGEVVLGNVKSTLDEDFSL